MEGWLTELLAYCPADLGWEAKRRWLIRQRWPQAAQNEAIQDNLSGRTAADGGKWEQMQADIAVIKQTVPKS